MRTLRHLFAHEAGVPQPVKNGKGTDDPGPRNLERDRQNPDVLTPPETDHGSIPNLRFSFSDAHNRVQQGGWAREITARELPVATTLAGVNMRLAPGGIRELHWHKQAEWSFMLVGKARITAVDQDGRKFVDDVEAGDLWYFPPAIPHSIQGLAEGCEFLLVFDDGDFSENSTFSLADWFAHTPKDVVSANFGVPSDQFNGIPKQELYIFQGKLPEPLEAKRTEPSQDTVALNFTYRLMAQTPVRASGGTVRIADSTNFSVSQRIAAALVEIDPDALREMHWHPTNDEWQYYVEGEARMTVFASSGKARTFNYRAGDVGYVPFAMGHYIQNIGKSRVRFLEVFKSDHYAGISLNQWLALTPPELVQDHLHLGRQAMEALSRDKRYIVNK